MHDENQPAPTATPSNDPHQRLAHFIYERSHPGQSSRSLEQTAGSEAPEEIQFTFQEPDALAPAPPPPLSSLTKQTLLVKGAQGLRNSLIFDSIVGWAITGKNTPKAVDEVVHKIERIQLHRREHSPGDPESQTGATIPLVEEVAQDLKKTRPEITNALSAALLDSSELFHAAQNATMSMGKKIATFFFVSRPDVKELVKKTVEVVDECGGDTKTREFREKAAEVAHDARAAATLSGTIIDTFAEKSPRFNPDAFGDPPAVTEDLRSGKSAFAFERNTKVGFINPSYGTTPTADQPLLTDMELALTKDGHDWPAGVSSEDDIPFVMEVNNEEFEKTRRRVIEKLNVNKILPLQKKDDWIDKIKQRHFGGKAEKTAHRSVNGVCVYPLYEALTTKQSYRISPEILDIIDDAPLCQFHSTNIEAQDHANKRFNDKNDTDMRNLKRQWFARNLLASYNDPESALDAAKVLGLCLVFSGGADQLADHLLPGGGTKAVVTRVAGLAAPDFADNSMGVYPEVKANLDAQDLENSFGAIRRGITDKNAPGSIIARRGLASAGVGTALGALFSIPGAVLNSSKSKRNLLLRQLCGWLPSSVFTASGIPLNYGLTLPDIIIAYQQNLQERKYLLPRGVDSENPQEVLKHCELMGKNELMARSGMANANRAFNGIWKGILPPSAAEIAGAPAHPVQTVQSVYSPMTENLLRLWYSWRNGKAVEHAEQDLEKQIARRAANNIAPMNPEALRRFSHNNFSGDGPSLTHVLSWPVRRFFSNDSYKVILDNLPPPPREESAAVQKTRKLQRSLYAGSPNPSRVDLTTPDKLESSSLRSRHRTSGFGFGSEDLTLDVPHGSLGIPSPTQDFSLKR